MTKHVPSLTFSACNLHFFVGTDLSPETHITHSVRKAHRLPFGASVLALRRSMYLSPLPPGFYHFRIIHWRRGRCSRSDSGGMTINVTMSRTTTKPINKPTTSITNIPVMAAPSASTGLNTTGREISFGMKKHNNKNTHSRTHGHYFSY